MCTLGASLNHGNLPRNVCPISNFSQTHGQFAGTRSAQALYLEDTTLNATESQVCGTVDAIASDLQTARAATAAVVVHHSAQVLSSRSHSFQDMDFLHLENCLHAHVNVANLNLHALETNETVAPRGDAKPDFVATACTQPDHILQQSIRDMVRNCVLQVVPGSNIGETDPLMESGADSLGSTELCNLLQARLGDAVQLPTTLVFD